MGLGNRPRAGEQNGANRNVGRRPLGDGEYEAVCRLAGVHLMPPRSSHERCAAMFSIRPFQRNRAANSPDYPTDGVSLSCYVFRVAISNRRILNWENAQVTFPWKAPDAGSSVGCHRSSASGLRQADAAGQHPFSRPGAKASSCPRWASFRLTSSSAWRHLISS